MSEIIEQRKEEFRLAVKDHNGKSMMPCTPARSRALVRRGEAKFQYIKNIRYVQLLRPPSAYNYQEVSSSLDMGSKREAYTVMTPKNVCMNIMTNTPHWVKANKEQQKALRSVRRNRNTPYRPCRYNRHQGSLAGFIPPSIKARHDRRYQTFELLFWLFPITKIVVEDINAVTKEGKQRWNQSFGVMQNGKNYLYNKLKALVEPEKFILKSGFETFTYRNNRGFNKSTKKLQPGWEGHCVDSHCLAEMGLGHTVPENRRYYKGEYLQFARRQLHFTQPNKRGQRPRYGGTRSHGLNKGTVVRWKKRPGELFYVGGWSEGKGGISLHQFSDSLGTQKRQDGTVIQYEFKERVTQSAMIKDLEILYEGTALYKLVNNEVEMREYKNSLDYKEDMRYEKEKLKKKEEKNVDKSEAAIPPCPKGQGLLAEF